MRAKYIKNVESQGGEKMLFEFDPPLPIPRWDEDEDGRSTKYAVGSAAVVMFDGPEVMFFEATEEGEIVSYSDLIAERGTLNIIGVLLNRGYDVENI